MSKRKKFSFVHSPVIDICTLHGPTLYATYNIIQSCHSCVPAIISGPSHSEKLTLATSSVCSYDYGLMHVRNLNYFFNNSGSQPLANSTPLHWRLLLRTQFLYQNFPHFPQYNRHRYHLSNHSIHPKYDFEKLFFVCHDYTYNFFNYSKILDYNYRSQLLGICHY